MSSFSDLADARQRFMAELDLSPQTANRIIALLEQQYSARALGQPREVVLEAASWAASRLRGLPSSQLAQADPEQLLARLQVSDCPLCINGTDDFRSSGTPSSAPPVPADAGR